MKTKTEEARVSHDELDISAQAQALIEGVVATRRNAATNALPPEIDLTEPLLGASLELKRACVLAALDVADRAHPAWSCMQYADATWQEASNVMAAAEAVLNPTIGLPHTFIAADIERIAQTASKQYLLMIFPIKPLISLLADACERIAPTAELAASLATIASQPLTSLRPKQRTVLRALAARVNKRLSEQPTTPESTQPEPMSYLQGIPIVERVFSRIEPPGVLRPRLDPTPFSDDKDAEFVRAFVSVLDVVRERRPDAEYAEAVRATRGYRFLHDGPASHMQRALVCIYALTALFGPTPSEFSTATDEPSRAWLREFNAATRLLYYIGLTLIAPASCETPSPEIAEELLLAAQKLDSSGASLWPGPQTCELIEMAFKAAPLSKRAREVATALRPRFARAQSDPWRHTAIRLDNILGVSPEILDRADRFAAAVIDDLAAMPTDRRGAWRALLEHALTATGSKPSTKWLKGCDVLIAGVGEQEFADRVPRWFALVGKKPETPEGMPAPMRDLTVPLETNSQALKGLVLMCARFDNAKMAGTLGDLALASFKMVSGVGARCIKVGTACIWSLGEMQGGHAAAQLSRARQLVKFGSARKWLDQAIDRVAFAAGLTADELQEVCTPDYDLSRDQASFATRRGTLGTFTAELAIIGTTSTEIRILDEQGRLRKSVPAAIKKAHAAELKSLQESAKDIEKMLPAQRDRLERLMADDRSWPFATWRERYIDHPLVGPAARRLIWQFSLTQPDVPRDPLQAATTTLGMVHEGVIVGLDRTPLPWLNDADEAPRRDIAVRLWHPLGAEPASVARCRQVLDEHAITQPFKQAHREVYVLTDAERRTRTYSNRFAAHIVRYPQLTKLAQDRGWTAGTLVIYDPSYCKNPLIKLPRWGVGAKLFVEGAGDENTPAGINSYAQTDQVRFFPLRAPTESLPLDQVPPLAFSEVMRDVDLFVAVASVGNDPTWQDRGERASEQFHTYWQGFAWGELSVGAQARRELLEKLLPRLAIRDKCQLLERFLVVQGSLRRYKIHLGSGNILMEPNDQYLCIVPKSATAGEAAVAAVRLPFEGDRTLTVILSKAFMLADDARITDPTITSQIRA